MHRSAAPPAVESFIPCMSSRGSSGSINIISCSSSTDSASSLLPVGFLPGLQGSASTTGMMAAILGGGGGTLIIPVELLLLLDLQYGGIVVQDGQNDLVHVLPQTQVDFLLLLQGLHQLRERRVCSFSSPPKVTYQLLISAEESTGGAILRMCCPCYAVCDRTWSLEALSISAARDWALVCVANSVLAS